MLDVHEHKRVLSHVREGRGRALDGHRQEVEDWRRQRDQRPTLHRVVLAGERAEMQKTRRIHKAMLAQNRWLILIAERLQERLKKAG